MKDLNYLATLTPEQLEKKKDKKGAMFYYEWYDILDEHFETEVVGAILMAVLHYDKCGGSKPIPSKFKKIIRKDKAAEVILKTFFERTAAASREWINRHKLEKKKESDNTDNNKSETEFSEIIIDDEALPF